MKSNWVCFWVGVVGLIALTVSLGHCECWNMVVSDGKYECEKVDCEDGIYDDKSVCEDMAFILTQGHRSRMLEEEEPKLIDPIDRAFRPDLKSKEPKGIKGCSTYSVNGCEDK